MEQVLDIDDVRLTGPINDKVADMLARIRNASAVMKDEVAMPSSKLLVNVCRIMRREGYINSYRVETGNFGEVLIIGLRYGQDRTSIITGMKRVSKPGRRVYFGTTELPRVRGGLGIAIMSTSKGVMTSKEAAGHGVGGEVLCTVW